MLHSLHPLHWHTGGHLCHWHCTWHGAGPGHWSHTRNVIRLLYHCRQWGCAVSHLLRPGDNLHVRISWQSPMRYISFYFVPSLMLHSTLYSSALDFLSCSPSRMPTNCRRPVWHYTTGPTPSGTVPIQLGFFVSISSNGLTGEHLRVLETRLSTPGVA